MLLERVVETAVQRDHISEGRAWWRLRRQAGVPVAQQGVQASLQRPWVKSKSYHVVESSAFKPEGREVVGQPSRACSLPFIRRSQRVLLAM